MGHASSLLAEMVHPELNRDLALSPRPPPTEGLPVRRSPSHNLAPVVAVAVGFFVFGGSVVLG
eukprot:m.265496 g.265496  ORF g.265496 m.265496 type:complete len:63 (+) comp54681_c0_seq1:2380-2568(+)